MYMVQVDAHLFWLYIMLNFAPGAYLATHTLIQDFVKPIVYMRVIDPEESRSCLNFDYFFVEILKN